MAYLEQAGLRRRVWSALFVMVLALVAAMAPLIYFAGDVRLSISFLWLQLVGSAVAAGSVYWLHRHARCDACRLPFVTYAWRGVPYDRWLVWLNTFEACPQCGARGNKALAPTQAVEPNGLPANPPVGQRRWAQALGNIPPMRPALKRLTLVVAGLLGVLTIAPEWPRVPVDGASTRDWNQNSFWAAPWGESGVHKGIDIFARKGTPVVAPTFGLVVFRGTLPLGGKVVAMIGPRLRLHYFAHLDVATAMPGLPVLPGMRLGAVGNSGNARGKPAHLHYAILSLLPYPWKADSSQQGWKKTFFIDPSSWLQGS